MSSKTSVDPGELRAAAHAEDSISDDMRGRSDKAIGATKDAAAALKGWTLSQALEMTAATWKPSLDGMRSRASTAAANLRTCAAGHEWNDAAASQDFENADARTQSAPAVMPAVAPAFVNRDNTSDPGRDPRAARTPGEMRNAGPMHATTSDSPFG
ncbi:hypothetical protein [Streptomyces noursei]|uniref:hypothetical protein n=1 Tax=Streptomyces noursei TaxID=1971 RepID=UPI001676528E|nr:hypothetical protein [Streptomyces noursei]MCZ1015441.1 hypothetical protein [Streptomyces noursei]GGX17493.1 hypothetical protein GCM10010341_43720 [Streptomyces noursei]